MQNTGGRGFECAVTREICMAMADTYCLFFFRRPNSFVIITANRVIHCNSDTPEEMHHWISLLQKPKGESKVDGQEFLVRGKRKCMQL